MQDADESECQQQPPTLDLSSVVTIVIVTSPIASNPSTEMMDRCISGIMHSFPALEACPVVIACDGVQVVEQDSNKQQSKRIYGKCTQQSFDHYQQFCHQLEKRSWLQVDRQTEWKGFALALKSALTKVATPLVMVLPHDYELLPRATAHVDIALLLQTMLDAPDICYIGLPNPRNASIKSRHAQALQGLPTRKVAGGRQGADLLLEPLAMWKENPHFAKITAYESIIFSRHYKRGQFIEDTLGQEMLAAIKEQGVKAFHHTYLLSSNQPCSYHMEGPRYLLIAERLVRKYAVQEAQIEAALRAAAFVEKRKLQSTTTHRTSAES